MQSELNRLQGPRDPMSPNKYSDSDVKALLGLIHELRADVRRIKAEVKGDSQDSKEAKRRRQRLRKKERRKARRRLPEAAYFGGTQLPPYIPVYQPPGPYSYHHTPPPVFSHTPVDPYFSNPSSGAPFGIYSQSPPYTDTHYNPAPPVVNYIYNEDHLPDYSKRSAYGSKRSRHKKSRYTDEDDVPRYRRHQHRGSGSNRGTSHRGSGASNRSRRGRSTRHEDSRRPESSRRRYQDDLHDRDEYDDYRRSKNRGVNQDVNLYPEVSRHPGKSKHNRHKSNPRDMNGRDHHRKRGKHSRSRTAVFTEDLLTADHDARRARSQDVSRFRDGRGHKATTSKSEPRINSKLEEAEEVYEDNRVISTMPETKRRVEFQDLKPIESDEDIEQRREPEKRYDTTPSRREPRHRYYVDDKSYLDRFKSIEQEKHHHHARMERKHFDYHDAHRRDKERDDDHGLPTTPYDTYEEHDWHEEERMINDSYHEAPVVDEIIVE